MKFSIVTISYNQAPYLEDAILSILNQDYPHIEHIVVDPGSTDGSREIIERYRGRISKIIFEPDKGAADGLNKGFAQATGDFFGFINSDDILLPGALSSIATHLSKRPETDILMGHTHILDEQGRLVRLSYTDKFSPRFFAYSGGITCQQGTFFSAELFRQTKGFDVDNRITWDGELFLDLLLIAKHPLYVKEFLGGFRVYENSITGGSRMRQQYQAYERQRFARIMGREWRRSDWFVWAFFRLRKHITTPRSLIERLLRGALPSS